MRPVRVLAPALLVAALVAGAGASTAASPRTLVVASGPITTFAQDGRFVAWAARDPGSGCVSVVHLRDLRTQRTSPLTRPGTPGCRMTAPVAQLAVAAEGGSARALWTRYETGNNLYHWLYAASSASARERDTGLVTESTADELRVVAAGDGAFLGYGWAHVGEEECDDDCPYVVRDGGVVRLGRNLAPAKAGGVAPAALLEAGGGLVALVPRGRVGEETSPRPELRDVELRRGSTLALVAGFRASAPVLALGVSSSRLAVLQRGSIEVFDTSGRRVSRHAVSARAAWQLAVGGTRVVYRVGRTIYVAGRRQAVAVAASDPIGLSLEGTRLAWAENVRGRGRIRAVTLG